MKKCCAETVHDFLADYTDLFAAGFAYMCHSKATPEMVTVAHPESIVFRRGYVVTVNVFVNGLLTAAMNEGAYMRYVLVGAYLKGVSGDDLEHLTRRKLSR